MIQALLTHWYYWQGVQCALTIRGSLISLIQHKILHIHSSVKSNYSSGVLINLASVDSDNLMTFCWNAIHEIWASPLTILISLVWLIYLLGQSAVVGCGIMLLSVFISAGMLHELRLFQLYVSRADMCFRMAVKGESKNSDKTYGVL